MKSCTRILAIFVFILLMATPALARHEGKPHDKKACCKKEFCEHKKMTSEQKTEWEAMRKKHEKEMQALHREVEKSQQNFERVLKNNKAKDFREQSLAAFDRLQLARNAYARRNFEIHLDHNPEMALERIQKMQHQRMCYMKKHDKKCKDGKMCSSQRDK